MAAMHALLKFNLLNDDQIVEEFEWLCHPNENPKDFRFAVQNRSELLHSHLK
jgi:hypothetical protein